MSRVVDVPVTWEELLRLPDRQLRRVITDRFKSALRAERLEAAQPMRLPRVLTWWLDAEVARLEVAAEEIYEQMLDGYPARARAAFAAKQKAKGKGPRVAPLDEWKGLVEVGESPDMALQRLGTNRIALERAARNHGRRDVLTLLGIQEATPAPAAEEVTAA